MALLKGNISGVSTLTTPGRIYFIQGENGGLIKIGWATWPALRMARMQPHSPVILTLLHHEAGNGRQERELHVRFASARQHGEWFDPVQEILDYIEQRKSLSSPPEYNAVDVGPHHPKGARAANYASKAFRRSQGLNPHNYDY